MDRQTSLQPSPTQNSVFTAKPGKQSLRLSPTSSILSRAGLQRISLSLETLILDRALLLQKGNHRRDQIFVGTQSTDGWSEWGKQSTSPLPSGILNKTGSREGSSHLPWTLGLQPFSAKLHKLTHSTATQPPPHSFTPLERPYAPEYRQCTALPKSFLRG